MKTLPWGIHTIANVVGTPDCATGLPDGRWVRSVPEPYTGNRITAAWWVLTGNAYAFSWPTCEQLADALNPYQSKNRPDR